MSNRNWVFGYGSLIWRPGFSFLRAEQATIEGVHRSLCVYSHHYRGTPERPGLVFGLKPGGECAGLAFEVADENWAEVHAYLRAREQVTGVYLEERRRVRLHSGDEVAALTYLVDLNHAQYAQLDSVEALHDIVRDAHGDAGSNVEYVLNTLSHLREMGIRDHELEQLGARLTVNR